MRARVLTLFGRGYYTTGASAQFAQPGSEALWQIGVQMYKKKLRSVLLARLMFVALNWGIRKLSLL